MIESCIIRFSQEHCFSCRTDPVIRHNRCLACIREFGVVIQNLARQHGLQDDLYLMEGNWLISGDQIGTGHYLKEICLEVIVPFNFWAICFLLFRYQWTWFHVQRSWISFKVCHLSDVWHSTPLFVKSPLLHGRNLRLCSIICLLITQLSIFSFKSHANKSHLSMLPSRILQKSLWLSRDVKLHVSCLSVFRDTSIFSGTTISFIVKHISLLLSFLKRSRKRHVHFKSRNCSSVDLILRHNG